VLHLKEQLSRKLSIPSAGFLLVHGGHGILEEDKLLSEYPSLGNGSTLFLLVPLLGGAERGNPEVDPTLPQTEEPCMVTHESFEDNGTVVLSMPCGHPMSPGGLMDYSWSELNAGKTKIECLQCTREWGAEVIKKYGGLSDEEFQLLEKALNDNFCDSEDKIKICTKCKSKCSRIDENNPRVECLICSKKLSRPYHFCWYCLQEWNRNSGIESCGYESCKDREKLQRLGESETVIIQALPEITVYKLRACPRCGELIQYRNPKTTCRKCSAVFCFNCLRVRVEGSYFCDTKLVVCSLAPVQQKIPKLHVVQSQAGGVENNVGNNEGANESEGVCTIL
jgi:hypothetical protein